MVSSSWRVLRPRGLPLLLLAALTTAYAQPPSPPAARSVRPDPLDPQASVPALRYASPLAAYRRVGEDSPVPWREANDVVTRIGGWRTYLREAQRATPVAPASPASPASQAAP